MPAYLVRITKTRDLVGIFVADDEDDLEFVMDECTDAPGCEYVELPAGGIMWESPAKPVPLDAGDPEDAESPVEEFPWNGASLTEIWWNSPTVLTKSSGPRSKTILRGHPARRLGPRLE